MRVFGAGTLGALGHTMPLLAGPDGLSLVTSFLSGSALLLSDNFSGCGPSLISAQGMQGQDPHHQVMVMISLLLARQLLEEQEHTCHCSVL